MRTIELNEKSKKLVDIVISYAKENEFTLSDFDSVWHYLRDQSWDYNAKEFDAIHKEVGEKLFNELCGK